MKIEKRDIVFALLVATIVYMAFRQKKAVAQTSTAEEPKGGVLPTPSVPTPSVPNPNSSNSSYVPPTPKPRATDYYRLKQDFSRKFALSPSATGLASFKKGQFIQGKRYSGDQTKMVVKPFGQGEITTTTEGKMPDFQMFGQAWVQIPESILEPIRPV